jgi:curved DNA-binding protein CbpA
MSASDTDEAPDKNKLVLDILNAKSLYDVLGVSPQIIQIDQSSLRKAYLKTSVAVHPDKCNHPQATQAFQRVAEAWGTLSDDSLRADYDAELRQKSCHGFGFSKRKDYDNDNSNDTHFAPDFERTHMPSFQEALFMFATVTSMFSGAGAGAGNATRSSSVASDFLETMFWAQQLANGRNQGNGNLNHDNRERDACDFNHFDYNGNNNNNDNNDSNKPHSATEAAANDPLRTGLALGSGLRTIAGVQRAMGMRKSAAATEKAAVGVQMAAVGVSVMKKANENPAVKRTLERGQDAFQNNPQLVNGLRASLKMAGSVIQAFHQAQQEAQQQHQQQPHGPGSSNPQR